MDCGGPCPACEIERPGIFGSLIQYAGRGGPQIFLIFLLLILSVCCIGVYYLEKKHIREIEKKYGYIVDNILEERGLSGSA